MSDNRAPRKITIRGDEPVTPTAPAVVETYKVYTKCDNCDWKGEVDIPKGMPAKKGEPLDALAVCPDCACCTLVRVEQPTQAVTYPPVPNDAEISREFERMMREAAERMQRNPPTILPPVSIPPYVPSPTVVPNIYEPYIGDQPHWTRPNYPTWTAGDSRVWNTTTSGSTRNSSSSSGPNLESMVNAAKYAGLRRDQHQQRFEGPNDRIALTTDQDMTRPAG